MPGLTVIEYAFVELGEGYSGEYDPTDPEDSELLRLDVLVNGEEVESLCTALPVTTDEAGRQKALDMVAALALSHRDLSHKRLTELFSHMDPTWLDTGIPAKFYDLFGLEAP